MFSLVPAVGLTPQLLPADLPLVYVPAVMRVRSSCAPVPPSLSGGGKAGGSGAESLRSSRLCWLMAENQVIVRRLPAIENFGSMNVLCSDKTGTITELTFPR